MPIKRRALEAAFFDPFRFETATDDVQALFAKSQHVIVS